MPSAREFKLDKVLKGSRLQKYLRELPEALRKSANEAFILSELDVWWMLGIPEVRFTCWKPAIHQTEPYSSTYSLCRGGGRSCQNSWIKRFLRVPARPLLYTTDSMRNMRWHRTSYWSARAWMFNIHHKPSWNVRTWNSSLRISRKRCAGDILYACLLVGAFWGG